MNLDSEMPRANEDLRIAIVDDDVKIRQALHRLLRCHGFNVESFDSGEEFLRVLDAREPDCLLLDLNMFGLTGWDVQRKLVAMGKTFPVIAVTGCDDPGLEEKAFATGLAGFLLKPFEGDDLLCKVRSALGGQRTR